jgi:hypothetical protein
VQSLDASRLIKIMASFHQGKLFCIDHRHNHALGLFIGMSLSAKPLNRFARYKSGSNTGSCHPAVRSLALGHASLLASKTTPIMTAKIRTSATMPANTLIHQEPMRPPATICAVKSSRNHCLAIDLVAKTNGNEMTSAVPQTKLCLDSLVRPRALKLREANQNPGKGVPRNAARVICPTL